MIISRLSSNTEIPVPSNSTLVWSFWDLNLKKTHDAMVLGYVVERDRKVGWSEEADKGIPMHSNTQGSALQFVVKGKGRLD